MPIIDPTATDGDEPPHFETPVYGEDYIKMGVPTQVEDLVALSDDYAAVMYPYWDEDDLGLGFHVEFHEGSQIAGRKVHYNEEHDNFTLRVPSALARISGLKSLANNAEVVLSYFSVYIDGKPLHEFSIEQIEDEITSGDMDGIDPGRVTIDITTRPSLTPIGGVVSSQADHADLDEKFTESGLTPSRSRDSELIESLRYEVPLDYARAYGFEPRQEVTVELIVDDGTLGLAFNLDGDIDDPHLATRSLNAYSPDSSGPRKDQYAVSVPKAAVRGLRWSLDMPLRAIPQADRFVLVPANPVGTIDETVKEDDVLVEELGEAPKAPSIEA
ncbi:hypothetical protein [Halorhabdus rudnickae]|uniref:hypothetical protein n=1 Tax=Halorhabdus rudnickae TaxID=1775544 RepID=UPI001082A76C|nr:hypothetical protein [Halorhabdus rudnickae]